MLPAVALQAELDQAEAEGRKRHGRKRKKPLPKTADDLKNTVDGDAYMYYVKDLADAAHAELGPGLVHLYQDSVGWHLTPGVMEEMQKHNLVPLGRPPARSPDLNPIENLFGFAEKRMNELWVQKPAKDAADTEKRFRKICKDAADSGELLSTVVDMPARFQAVIDNDGGPIPW